MSKKVLVTLDIPEKGLQMLRNARFELTVGDSASPFSYEELLKLTHDFEYIIPSSKDKIDRNFLENNRQLKVISTFSAGFDHIDIQAANEFGIPVGHTPQAMNKATSDIAFGLMIAVSRNFFQLNKKIEASNWGGFRPRADLGQELYGKTLGVFGLGAIGFEMARKCKAAYQMDIIYCNRSVNAKAEKDLGAQKVNFEELLELSDVISVHSNLSEETKHIFNKSAFTQMKKTAIFVNTSRGKVHQETDLINALKEGQIWGAGLDVTDPEPMKPDNPLLQMPNVCVLPHIGSATVEARDEMSRLAAANLLQYLENGTMIHCVNPKVLS
ncbi:2-hydroxyacid dehydrogenase [Jiulongibacter sediminis]|uniref:Hydroxyacid dehydrogenase n=1 Tax=Jiulongibacter sediminis TaxID=1605367 RepID=A0A0N8H9F9_9BACT|nr:D-glycerate dehydrogenase [Jiulongibacter sediminis]KPM47260.1 hydroxyacid dehydrogenase [Jiulongibacter sediminis]TBX22818.1 hydroxyacid dehydrogenase [Jiulongibacter sediminis]